ncbi:MAG: glycosyltransferase family 4 protein [Halothece sp. Uz-M2-17]|nr:glycosyltransferase family 4 protein [Halothece sp. Uz-M2-17]
MTKKRRILFLNHSAVLGGGELCLIDLAQTYQELSQVLLLSHGDLSEKLRNLGIKFRVLPAPEQVLSIRASSTWESLKAVSSLWQIAGEIASFSQNFEIIHANSQKAFIVAALARLRGSPPVVWHLRDILTASHFSRVNCKVATTLANRYATQVIVNSQATGEAFVQVGGNPQLVNVVYDGICPESFMARISKTPNEIRQELGLINLPLIGVFSRLSYWKGQHILLEAVKQLPEVHVLIVGDALFGETDYVNQIKSLIELPELQGRVHWLGFRDDIPSLMQACDLIVHPSTAPEPFGRVIIEAQLAQKPIIASATGGAVELIEDGCNGRLFPAGDTGALAEIIQTLLTDTVLSSKLAQQGAIQARQKFSLEQSLRNFDAVLDKV